MGSEIDLHGKRILVIGGETALGRTLVVALAEAGADVAIASLSADARDEFAINSALNELWAMDRQGIALSIDAANGADVRQAVQRAERELGRLDLAAVVAPEEEAVALGALREALAEREVLVLAPETHAAEAFRTVSERF